VLWDTDPKDFACTSPSELARKLENHPLAPGNIVLMHDNHPHAAEVLPHVISAARSNGLHFTTINQWLRE
jgi:peptidoglycan/xylan/chitin deacetylase (PgdA/CDA1 family)